MKTIPLAISNFTGDGVTGLLISTSIELPDSGATVLIGGEITPVGGSGIAVTGSPLTAPAVPVSGVIYWAIEVNTTTGVATVIQSTTAMPTPDPGAVIVFSQTLSPASPDPALVATDSTPDSL